MTDKKPIVINLCKIGWGAWILVSAVFLFCLISEESANLTWTETPQSEPGDWVENSTGNGVTWDSHATRTYTMDCYQGILDNGKQCQSDNEDAHGTFVLSSLVFTTINVINGFLWFVALNRKYGKYEFKFKKCDGDFL